jgi:hypothetical protein
MHVGRAQFWFILICPVFYVRYMGNVLFSCDGYVVTPVQVDIEVMGWKKKNASGMLEGLREFI